MSANVLERPEVRAPQGEPPAETGTPAGREIPAWAISLAVHVVLLLLFNSIINPAPPREDLNTIIDSAITPEISADALRLDVTETDQIGSDSPLNTINAGRAAAQDAGNQPKMVEQVRTEFKLNPIPTREEVRLMPQANLMDVVATVGSTEYAGGTEGAIDRLTEAIADSLREKKTLVIWMMDASLSLRDRRETIAQRIENVYKQLGLLEVDADRALKSAVVSYGEKVQLMTEEPVDDFASVSKAIRAIKNDESGKEVVFTAVQEATKHFKEYRTKMGRNILVFIVTDERGDDYGLLEDCIAFCRRYGIRVSCVGNAAVFGREKGYVTWRYEDGSFEDLPVDQGPETVAPEHLQLGFWGVNSRDLDRMSASFGPYALTRLCVETGGMYFITEETRELRFDPAVMRSYQPDYRPIADYQRELQKNLAKQALVATATETAIPGKEIPIPRLDFPAENDTVLRQAITEAQKPASVLDAKLIEMQTKLEIGEKDRQKLTNARWRASYDLAMGRVLAMHVRAYGYNATLAEMKVAPKTFEKKGSNRWRLVSAPEINTGPQVKKMAEKARQYLKRVIDEHPGTPWSELAQRELGTPLGWKWEEYGVAATQMKGPANDPNKPMLLLAEEKKKEMERKKKQMERAKNRPKL